MLGLNQGEKKQGRSYAELFDMGYINIEPLTYIRGRSLPSVFMIVDEAQNLTPHEVKTIITRAGEGTKIVFTGDPYQIDLVQIDVHMRKLHQRRFHREDILRLPPHDLYTKLYLLYLF